ncbi:hypothetical protein P153DRAFT_351411 [Dothidotthia symphoricarpi CBS 119687]|uniref:Uncharacterized protein n=1 Tax=Dothidotthia symphoricarpi CBS 119687 TaxID=1392245 RepID=A0A6A5ZWH9_9PLEO|nr:uncharacterized protein P153DRAFT_351411 [Dothidotthia symphoricarpi CBS 119687]KAF2123889.1 hypothetical protein P153DRAFT_351411 [Dothidotthia symphoricarpi CBS 119687]
MRYSSAMVLSTFAVGQAAASHMHNRHASFHERRQAEAKRSAGADVDWNKVAVDLKDVDWEAVNWSSVFQSSTAVAAASTPAAVYSAAAATATQAKADAKKVVSSVVEAAYTPVPTKVASVVAVASKVASSKAAVATSAAESTVSTDSIIDDLGDAIDDIGDAVSDLLHGVSTLIKSLGIVSVGKNSKTNNGGIWIGSDSEWKAEFTNDASEDAVIFCWKADGYSGMSLNVNQPEISVGLKAGESVEVSFAENVPAACAPAYTSTKLALFGGIDQTWWEVTFGSSGAFDVSRNVNMNGCTINSKGSKCTSNMDTCVFKCKDSSASSCESGSDYDLFNCDSSSGGGGGYDAVMAGTGGGCAMGSSGETVKVSFN